MKDGPDAVWSACGCWRTASWMVCKSDAVVATLKWNIVLNTFLLELNAKRANIKRMSTASKCHRMRSLIRPTQEVQVDKAQFTAENWTELNSTGSFNLVQFSAVHWTGDELRRPATAVAGSRQSRTVAARRRFSSNDRHCVDWPIHMCVPIVKNLRRPPISSPVQCTAGNWTEQFSSVSRCALIGF